jgi:hypothetical protein
MNELFFNRKVASLAIMLPYPTPVSCIGLEVELK